MPAPNSKRRAIRSAVVVALISLVSGCIASPSTAPIVTEQVMPTPTANPWLAETEVSRAIVFRQRVGLRFDEGWVRYVAGQPILQAGLVRYGIPLTDEELAELVDRAFVTDDVTRVVEQYGESRPAEWAGAFVDAARGLVVASFTDHVDEHDAALRRMISPEADLAVRKVDWTFAELGVVFERVRSDFENDREWFLSEDMYPLGVGIDIRLNRVLVDVSSARADVTEVLAEHYAAAGILRVTSDGTGVRLLGNGSLRGRVVDGSGEPVSGADIRLVPDIEGAGPQNDIGILSDTEGRFEIESLSATGYEVQAWSDDVEGGGELLGSIRARVKVDQTTQVVIIATTS